MVMFENVRKDLKIYIKGMEKGKETLKEECH